MARVSVSVLKEHILSKFCDNVNNWLNVYETLNMVRLYHNLLIFTQFLPFWNVFITHNKWIFITPKQQSCAVDIKRIVGVVLLDLSAAFDTVDHDMLLSMLQWCFGVCDSALSWVKSYLSDTTVNYLVNGVSSGPVAVNFSVPHGSVLGPIKFISYTEGVSTVFHWHRVRHHL